MEAEDVLIVLVKSKSGSLNGKPQAKAEKRTTNRKIAPERGFFVSIRPLQQSYGQGRA